MSIARKGLPFLLALVLLCGATALSAVPPGLIIGPCKDPRSGDCEDDVGGGMTMVITVGRSVGPGTAGPTGSPVLAYPIRCGPIDYTEARDVWLGDAACPCEIHKVPCADACTFELAAVLELYKDWCSLACRDLAPGLSTVGPPRPVPGTDPVEYTFTYRIDFTYSPPAGGPMAPAGELHLFVDNGTRAEERHWIPDSVGSPIVEEMTLPGGSYLVELTIRSGLCLDQNSEPPPEGPPAEDPAPVVLYTGETENYVLHVGEDGATLEPYVELSRTGEVATPAAVQN